MANNNRGGRPSYFAEMRQSKADPNFFNREDPNRIRQNVKRIIRDIANGNILDEDYIYFMNNNLMNACIIETQEQLAANNAIAMALLYYKNNILPRGLQPYWVDQTRENAIVAQEHTKATIRLSVWGCFMDAIQAVTQCGADPKMAFMQICRFRNEINGNILG